MDGEGERGEWEGREGLLRALLIKWRCWKNASIFINKIIGKGGNEIKKHLLYKKKKKKAVKVESNSNQI